MPQKIITFTLRTKTDLGADPVTILRAMATAERQTPKATIIEVVRLALDDWAIANPDRVGDRIAERARSRREMRAIRLSGKLPDPEPTRCACVRSGLRCSRPVSVDGATAEATQRCATCAGICSFVIRPRPEGGNVVALAHLTDREIAELLTAVPS